MRQSLSEYDDRHDSFSLVGEPREDEAAPPRDRRLPKFLLTGGVVAVFVGGLWFAYVQGTHRSSPNVAVSSDGVPLLKADPSPTKVKPEQPGGMAVPNQNVSLYGDKPAGPNVERLLPAPEKPMPRPAPPPPPPIPGPPEAALPAPPPAVPATAEPAKPGTKSKPGAEKQASLIPPQSDTAPSTSTASVPPAARTGAVQVQLGSVRTPDAARAEWSKLKKDNADLLGSLKANAVKTNLGERGIFYRIEAGPFPDTAAAERLCGEMKQRNLGCILVR